MYHTRHVRIVKHSFEIIHLTTRDNPLQVLISEQFDEAYAKLVKKEKEQPEDPQTVPVETERAYLRGGSPDPGRSAGPSRRSSVRTATQSPSARNCPRRSAGWSPRRSVSSCRRRCAATTPSSPPSTSPLRSERLQTDSLVFNELGNPDDLVATGSASYTPLEDWRDLSSLKGLLPEHQVDRRVPG